MNTQTRATWLSEMLQELGLALVTPDGPPVKFNDPPSATISTSRKASRFPSENMDPTSLRLASGIATMNDVAISA